MPDPADRYADWKAPQEDGELLLWPKPAELFAHAAANNRLLNSAGDVLIQNTPLAELRRDTRRFLGFHDDHQLVFASGHQTELHHPGVWAKNVLIDVAATKAGGIAAHFAVDTDAPKHLVMRFPGFAEPFTDDPALLEAPWAGLLLPPTPAHLQQLADRVAAATKAGTFQPAIAEFFSILRPLQLDAERLPAMLTAALHEFDWKLGLRYSAMLTSPIWHSPPYLAFVHHLLANADRFAADYNAALRAYRVRHGIRTPGRPMPDLARKEDRCETPFWRDDLTRGRRVRAWVERSGEHWSISAGDDCLPLDPRASADAAANALLAWMRRNNLRLAPRALVLTIVLRLLAADQFVHGIGGGQYDQVADDVMHRHFGIDPPRFAVTTATLFWPEAAGRRRTSIPDIQQRGHRLRHSLLGREKRSLIEQIAAAPRKSVQRQTLFQEMRRRLDTAAANHPALVAWEAELHDASARIIEERALFDRELFYPLQPRARLEQLIQQYRDLFT
jgi:hypothetical protein